MYFSPEREALQAEDVRESLSLRRLSGLSRSLAYKLATPGGASPDRLSHNMAVSRLGRSGDNSLLTRCERHYWSGHRFSPTLWVKTSSVCRRWSADVISRWTRFVLRHMSADNCGLETMVRRRMMSLDLMCLKTLIWRHHLSENTRLRTFSV